MVEYHVGSGMFGIYAGTLNPERKDGLRICRNRNSVTDEAIEAVKEYMKNQTIMEKSDFYSYTWNVENGKKIVLSLEIKEK